MSAFDRRSNAAMTVFAKVWLPRMLALAGLAQPGLAAAQRGAAYPMKVCVSKVWSTPGDSDFGFVWPGATMQWPDGTIWVSDTELSEVWAFSSEGLGARRVLREGDGPREIRRARSFATSSAGDVVLRDDRGFLFLGENKRFVRRLRWGAPVGFSGMVATGEGGFILSGGFGDSEHELARWAVHRFDGEGRPVKSWHPALNHPKWETVRRASGGPMAVTRDGGLLVSDAAPFRITRYADLLGNGAHVVIEDEQIVSASEADRAVTYEADGYSTTNAWTQSVFLHERENGDILNVVKVWPEEGPSSSEWLVVSPEGDILARTPVETGYGGLSATPDGHYLATYWDDPEYALAKLDVEVRSWTEASPAPAAGCVGG